MKYLKLIVSVVFVLIIGFLGSIFTSPNINSWYVTLEKPAFNPPNYLFAPVWTVLYIFIGIALYLIWTSKSKYKTIALWLFFIQLVLNFLWSYIFFSQKLINLAMFEIALLWVVIIACIYYFWKISKLASYLFIPYLLWVSFASILNYYILVLN